MFLPFKIAEKEIRDLVEEYNLPRKFSKQYRDVKSLIRDSACHFWDNGSRMEEVWFPTKEMVECNVFISHSHKDIRLVKRFASWLNEKLGLTCFIDSLYWENADELLDFLCWHYPYYRFPERHYACELREELSSHVHAMLSMALMKMMDQTECLIFVESDNALTRWGSQTMSPWLYEETNFANLLCSKVPERMKSRVVDSTRGPVLELLTGHRVQLHYDVDFGGFGNLYSEQLRSIYGQELHGEDALDAIYRLHKPSGNDVRN